MSNFIWVNIATQSTTVPDRIDSTFNPAANIPFMVAHNWRMLDLATRPVVPPGYVLISSEFVQNAELPDWATEVLTMLTQEEYDAQQAAAEIARQEAKPAMLKAIENIYVGFLTNEWTPVLRTMGLIAEDYTITVQNTDTTTNMTYLMTMRQMDTNPLKTTYNYFAGEFERLKSTIESLGGIMSDVIYHS